MSDYFAEAIEVKEDSLEHHGVLGQKWGIRRYQNKDGSLTAEGKKRASEGTEGVRKVLEKGQSQVIRKRTFGNIKSGASVLGTLAGTTAAGAAIGSTGGPLGTLAGGYTGFILGVPTSAAVSYLVKKHADVKANALEDQYRMLGQKMMKEVGKIKVSDIVSSEAKPQSVATRNPNKAKEAADDLHKQGVYTMEFDASDGKYYVEPIKDQATARKILKDDAYKEQTKAIKAAQNQINLQNQINTQNQINVMNNITNQAARDSINAGLMTASLGATGGATPYAFGMV